MYLYFNKNGVLQEIINDKALRRYNQQINTLYVYIENSPTTELIDGLKSLSYWFERPNGDITETYTTTMHLGNEIVTESIPFCTTRDIHKFEYGVKYKMFKIPIPCGRQIGRDANGKSVFEYNLFEETGAVALSIKAHFDTKDLVLGKVNFSIEDEVILPFDQISISQFEYLLNAVNSVYGFEENYITKSEFEAGIESAGKVNDVLAVDGSSVVTDKVARLSKDAVGLDKVDNTTDSEKEVKSAKNADEAVKVSNKLSIKGTTTNGAEYDGAMPISLAFNDEDFGVSQSTSESGGKTVTIDIKDKGYAKKSEVDASLEEKFDKTGGTVSGDLTVGGNLKVNGEVTEFKSTTLLVADKLVEVAKGNVEPLASPAGIVVNKTDGTNDYGIVVDETNTFMAGKVVKNGDGNIDTNASDLHPVVTRSALIDDKLVKWNGKDQRLEPDQSKYAKSDEDELIAGDWTFTNQNGFKTNKIENVNGNSAYEFVDDTINRYGSTQVPLQFAGSNDRPKYTKDGTTFKEIALLEDVSGTSEAENAVNAKNVTDTINGKNISDIFEENGTTVKNATNANTATRANVATRAENVDTANVANRVANALRISGQNENGTEQTFDYNGSAVSEVAFDENDFNTTKTDDVMAVELRETGVLDGELDENGSGLPYGIYSAVRVDRKGRVTQGGKSIEVGTKGQTAPSDLLINNGLFLNYVEDGVYKPEIKTDDENNTEEVKLPYSSISGTPSLDNFTDKTNDQDVKGVWKFQNTNGLYANRIHNGVGNAVYDYDGTNVRLGSLAKPTHLRGSEERPKYQTSDDAIIELALKSDVPTKVSDLELDVSIGEATKVSNPLTVKDTSKDFVEYDGAMPIDLEFNSDDFDLAQLVTGGVKVGVKDKGYATADQIPTNYVTTDTNQTIDERKWFNLGVGLTYYREREQGGGPALSCYDDSCGDGAVFAVQVSGEGDPISDSGKIIIDEAGSGAVPIEIADDAGTAGQVLTSQGAGKTPIWGTPVTTVEKIVFASDTDVYTVFPNATSGSFVGTFYVNDVPEDTTFKVYIGNSQPGNGVYTLTAENQLIVFRITADVVYDSADDVTYGWSTIAVYGASVDKTSAYISNSTQAGIIFGTTLGSSYECLGVGVTTSKEF